MPSDADGVVRIDIHLDDRPCGQRVQRQADLVEFLRADCGIGPVGRTVLDEHCPVTLRVTVAAKCDDAPFERLRRGAVPQHHRCPDGDELRSHPQPYTVPPEHYMKGPYLLADKRHRRPGIAAPVKRDDVDIAAELFDLLVFFDLEKAGRLIHKPLASGIHNPEEDTV